MTNALPYKFYAAEPSSFSGKMRRSPARGCSRLQLQPRHRLGKSNFKLVIEA